MNGKVNSRFDSNEILVKKFRLTGASIDQAIKSIAIDNSKSTVKDLKSIVKNEYNLNPIVPIKFIANSKILSDFTKIAELNLRSTDVITVMAEQAYAVGLEPLSEPFRNIQGGEYAFLLRDLGYKVLDYFPNTKNGIIYKFFNKITGIKGSQQVFQRGITEKIDGIRRNPNDLSPYNEIIDNIQELEPKDIGIKSDDVQSYTMLNDLKNDLLLICDDFINTEINSIKRITTVYDQFVPIFSGKDLLDSNLIGERSARWIVSNGKQGKAMMLEKYINAIGYDGFVKNLKNLKDSDIFNLFREKYNLGKFEERRKTTGNVAYMLFQNEYSDNSIQTVFSLAFSKEEPLPGTTRSLNEKNRLIYSIKNNKIANEYLAPRPFSEFHAERKQLLGWLYKTDWKNMKKCEVTIASERGFCSQCYKYIYLDVFRYLNDIGYNGELTIKIRNLRATSSDTGGVCTNPKFDNFFIDNSENQNIKFEYQTFLKYYKIYGQDIIGGQPYYHYINEIVKSRDW